ncbi:MAG: hypothetical protein ACFFB6_10320 [Promethearchaeota archaeon]
MENESSNEIQAEIDAFINKIQKWRDFFDFQVKIYFDGWAISLREKNLYPRLIIIFKSFENKLYSLKSFEVHLKDYQHEEFKEIYSVDNIDNLDTLVVELKEIIYGKDLMKEVSKIYKNAFIK